MRQKLQTIGLASRDYFYEWQISICFVLALAAVLGPMMVLFGLKFGIVNSMIEELIEDPAKREIQPVGSGRYTPEWIAQIAQRKDVSFIVPKTRSLAAIIAVQSPKSARILNLELIPSAPLDPLLDADEPAPAGFKQVVLSSSAAKKLQINVGETIQGHITRQYQGKKERVVLDLEVVAIAPATGFKREGIFTSIALAEAIEDYRDGRAVPALGWRGDAPVSERVYTGFRLYARSIYDVAHLEQKFNQSGIEVRTQAAEIESVRRLDQTLSGIYWAIALIGLGGFSLSLGASLWANVDRKRKELSVLRLVGFHTGDIILFPTLQGIYTAVLGWALAWGIYAAAAAGINMMLAPQLDSAQEVCYLLPEHYVIALGITVGAALIAALLAGIRSARIEPSEGLREI